MVNRVQILPSGLWVSKAGIDVTGSVNESNYIFSSDFKASRIFKSGSVSVAAQSQATVTYGKTLNGAPLGVFYVLEGSNYIHPCIQTSNQTTTLEYRASFGLSSVIFMNHTTTARVFHYIVKELET